MRILLVEDDPTTSRSIELMLTHANLNVYCTDMGEDGIDLAKLYDYDLILLDLNLPDMSGHEVLRQLRLARIETPILILTGADDTDNKIKSFGFGADDYLTKPFNLEELLLRVDKLIKKSERLGSKLPVAEIYEFGKNKIDFKASEAWTKDGERVTLTKKEIMLLKLLVENKNEVVTREKILQVVWGYNVYPTTRTIDNFILNFRKYFEEDSRAPEYFHSVRGVGYKFTHT